MRFNFFVCCRRRLFFFFRRNRFFRRQERGANCSSETSQLFALLYLSTEA